MKRVYVTRMIPDAGLNIIRENTDMKLWEGQLPPPREQILKNVVDCEGILSLLTSKMDAEIMDAAPNLKVISNFAVGYDNVDIAAATKRGLPVGNTPGVLTETTADLAFSLLMAAARRLVEGERYVKAGKWKTWGPTLLMGPDVHGATLGVVGFGRIGRAMAQRATGFNMRVVYTELSEIKNDMGAEHVSLDDLLEQSDFVSLHTPLTPETHHLISTQQLAKMKSTAVLINTARGPIVDPKALYEALKAGEIGYAALDVTDPEPIEMDDPLLTLDNCIIIPHLGSASVATRNKMAEMAAANLLAGLKGERLPNCVNPEVYG